MLIYVWEYVIIITDDNIKDKKYKDNIQSRAQKVGEKKSN